MDFGAILSVAQQKTQANKNEVRYYKTKFEPPKKEERKATKLSANIQKFLARREAEEKKKAEEARIKKNELLALRAQDSKAKKRVNFMLNRTKSANRSVIEDAVDHQNTSITLAGPSQPDEDDYGYESQESALIYAKMMERYNAMPEEEKFPGTKKRSVSTNLIGTKERVKAALLKEEEEANAPHKRKRKSKHSDTDSKSDDRKEKEEKYDKYEEKEKEVIKPPKPKRPCPPPIDFTELLKIAEKKQFEPIIIEPKKVEEEPLMTKKQRRELEKEKAWKESREARLRAALTAPLKPKEGAPTLNKIPKLNQEGNKILKQEPKKMAPNGRIPKLGAPKTIDNTFKKPEPPKDVKKPQAPPKKSEKSEPKSESKPDKKYLPGDTRYKPPADSKPEKKYLPGDMRYKPPSAEELKKSKSSDVKSKMTPESNKPKQFPPADVRRKNPGDGRPNKSGDGNRPKQFPPADVRPKQFPPADVRPKQFPPADVRPKQFPPADVRSKQFPPSDVRRKGPPPSKSKPKRPIIEDDDSEYDSELDDFIDDGPLAGEEDYSKHIREIFGYDKSRYKDVDDEDDRAMESRFCTIMKEEQISAKIGLMEDLEDMKKEEEYNKRKAQMKKMRR